MGIAAIKRKAEALFKEASFISQINNEDDYKKALALMDDLIEDYDQQKPLIDVLSISIEHWENASSELAMFNQKVLNLESGVSTLKFLMEQYGLGVSDFSDIGSKSLLSRILTGSRSLTRKHIEILSERFGVSPSLFF